MTIIIVNNDFSQKIHILQLYRDSPAATRLWTIDWAARKSVPREGRWPVKPTETGQIIN